MFKSNLQHYHMIFPAMQTARCYEDSIIVLSNNDTLSDDVFIEQLAVSNHSKDLQNRLMPTAVNRVILKFHATFWTYSTRFRFMNLMT